MTKNNQNKGKTYFWQKIVLIIFGLFVTIIILEAGLRAGEFVFLSLQEYRNRLTIKQKGTYRIMCLGESTTALGGNDSYPFQLGEILNQRNIGTKFSVINKGWVGINTSHILYSLESNLEAYHPDMVITMMGINDWGPHMPYEDVSDFKPINSLKSFRTYKLTRLLWLYIVNRLEELKSDKLTKNTIPVNFLLPRGELQQIYAEEKAIELKPQDDKAYIELGCLYTRLYVNYVSKGQEFFKKAIELKPQDDKAYIELGCVYMRLGACYAFKAANAFRKAIELNPRSDKAYIELGCLYTRLYVNYVSKGQEFFKKAIELNPRSDKAYIELGCVYRAQGKLPEAEASFKKAIELNPRNDKAYVAIKELHIEMGNPRSAREHDNEVKELRLNDYLLVAIGNYNKLKEILDKRRIKLVCVQYPMRNLDSLKKIFQGNEEGIIFVDNEKIFKEAVAKDGSKNYFTDTFAGDFGHCTKKGNRLLAENIANTILREYFHK